MKKVSSLVMLALVAVMLFGLVGCGQKEEPPVETPVVDAPVVEEPDVIEEVEPQDIEISMAEIVNTLKHNLGENYLPSMLLEQDVFNQLVGLTSDMYDEFYAEVPMMSAHVDKLFIVRTSNTTAVEEAFKAYHTIQVEDAMQYPMNLTKVENAVITTQGDYVMYFILGGYSTEVFDDIGMTPEEIEAKQAEIETAWAKKCGEDVLAILDGLFVAGYDETIPDYFHEAIAAFEEMKAMSEPVVDETTELTVEETTEPVVEETIEATETPVA